MDVYILNNTYKLEKKTSVDIYRRAEISVPGYSSLLFKKYSRAKLTFGMKGMFTRIISFNTCQENCSCFVRIIFSLDEGKKIRGEAFKLFSLRFALPHQTVIPNIQS